MTQIKKTLSIAGIIALATAPAMADIASTDYVQSIVNNVIPKTGTVGHVLKKTATGLEWAAAPTPTLETTTGTSTTASMTQKAITDALSAKLSNTATDTYGIAIGSNAVVLGEDDADFRPMAIGDNSYAEYNSLAIGYQASTPQDGMGEGVAIGYGSKADSDETVAIGNNSHAEGWGGTAIGEGAYAGEMGVAIGSGASATYGPGEWGTAIGGWETSVGKNSVYGIALGAYAQVGENTEAAIQLGPGKNNMSNSLSVGLDYNEDGEGDGDYISYPLLVSGGLIPAERLTGRDSTSNLTSNKVLQFNSATKTMSWVDAPSAPTLASLLPELPTECNSVKCALVHDNTDGQYKWEVVKVSE